MQIVIFRVGGGGYVSGGYKLIGFIIKSLITLA